MAILTIGCEAFVSPLLFGSSPEETGGSSIRLINIQPGTAPALTAAAEECGLSAVSAKADEAPAGRVLVWEAQQTTPGNITPARVEALEKYVRDGGSLLLTLADRPGHGPFRLSPILPTLAWQPSASNNLLRGATLIGERDPQFFPAALEGAVPSFFEIRPFHAVERGRARYERFSVPTPFNMLDAKEVSTLPPNDDCWTRPLLNRDWKIRLRGQDFTQSPLLITGQYGAGRVAVWASSAEGCGDTSSTRLLWKGVLTWLKELPPSPSAVPSNYPAPATQIDRERHSLRVTLTNPGSGALPLQVVARLLTWEGAPVGDQLRAATVAAGGRVDVDIPLPKPSPTGYQALDFKDAFIVRLGVLSGDGRNLLHEDRLPVDFESDLKLAVQTEEERSRSYPFNGAAPGKGFRMGTQIPAYSYLPGATVNTTITLSNGLTNLTPKAKVTDETTPENPSTMALSDGPASSEKGPADGITAYGEWSGAKGTDNVLKWKWPSPVTISAVTVYGAGDHYRNRFRLNPPAIIVEADGKEVAREMSADTKFMDSLGQLRLSFPPVTAQTLRLKLPWVAKNADGSTQTGICIGKVEIEGVPAAQPTAKPVKGTLSVDLVDVWSGKSQPVGERQIEVEPLSEELVKLPVTLPGADDKSARFWRIEARFVPETGAALRQEAPVMSVEPKNPLLSVTAFRPEDTASMGFIVTRGFRNILENAIGTTEIIGGWGQPDDLVWAYAHGFKQEGGNARDQAGRLYVSENDMRHYSTPWRSFLNGDEFYATMVNQLVERMKEHRLWKQSKVVLLEHSDRWDTGPQVGAMHSWQDLEGFNDYLKAQGGRGLIGRTLQEISAEISANYPHEWAAWHLSRYVNSVRLLREAFAREGKELTITAQGLPLVPPAYEGELSKVIKGSSDDSTWGMASEDRPFTTGRQMSMLAFNPAWQMSTLIQWGWESGELGNSSWHSPVGTTEPSRRSIYDAAFRGLIRPDGSYTSMTQYGYNTNGGFAYTMTPNDFTEWNRVQERETLLTPETSWGAGLVLSNSHLDDPKRTSFDGAADAGQPGLEGIGWTMAAQRYLYEGGLPVSFTANACNLKNWPAGAPLIAVNLWEWSDQEIAQLKELAERGTHVAALGLPGGKTFSPAAATLLGVTPGGDPAAGAAIDEIIGRKIVKNKNVIYVPVAAKDLTSQEGHSLASLWWNQLDAPLQFSPGSTGYGFVSNGKRFIVVEDWREEGRAAPLRIRSGAESLQAINVNEHTSLATHRDGNDWVIDVPLRPGDSTLVGVNE